MDIIDIEAIGFHSAGTVTSLSQIFLILNAHGLYRLEDAIRFYESWVETTRSLPNPKVSAHYQAMLDSLRMAKDRIAKQGHPGLSLVPGPVRGTDPEKD